MKGDTILTVMSTVLCALCTSVLHNIILNEQCSVHSVSVSLTSLRNICTWFQHIPSTWTVSSSWNPLSNNSEWVGVAMESEISEPSRQGWMRTTMSKMSKINKWADRYFVLHGATLYYYLKNTDTVMFIMITLSRYIFTQVTIRVINSVDITM